jgi:hypothetical protein
MDEAAEPVAQHQQLAVSYVQVATATNEHAKQSPHSEVEDAAGISRTGRT